jgi:pyruvate carboxylase subunit B
LIYHVTIGGRSVVVEVEGSRVTVDGVPRDVELTHLPDSPVHGLLVDGASHRVTARRQGAGIWDLHLGGRPLRAEVVDERALAIRAMTGGATAAKGPRPVIAPMPGMVVRVEVSEGDTVRAGQGVVIVEAMKMENELKAEGPGVVTRVHVREGEAVEKDQRLVDLAPLDEARDPA